MNNDTNRQRGRKTRIARNLRKKFTPVERKLWTVLRNRHLGGLKFYRQFPIGPYVADFCCRSKKLVIEVDGGVHVGRERKDLTREKYINKNDYIVLRFTNDQVMNDINQITEVILKSVVVEIENLDSLSQRERDTGEGKSLIT